MRSVKAVVMIFRNMALLKECRMVTVDLEISVSLI